MATIRPAGLDGQYVVVLPYEFDLGGPDRVGAARSGTRRILVAMASYTLNEGAVAHAKRLIESRQYVLDSDWTAA